MKVAIIGAGAMGQLFGAKMVDAGEDVVFLDVDQRTVDALNNEGIEVVNTAGERTVKVSATASQPANWNEPVDFALFFVKGFYTQDAIESARHLFNENTIALTLQNGLGNGEVLVRAFGPDRALDGVTDYSAYRPGKNTVSSSAYGAIRIGGASVDGDASAAAEKVRDLFERCGFNAEVHADVRVPIWESSSSTPCTTPSARPLTSPSAKPSSANPAVGWPRRSTPRPWRWCARSKSQCAKTSSASTWNRWAPSPPGTRRP